MKLAVCNATSPEVAISDIGPTTAGVSFDDCRALLRHQSPAIAMRLGRLADAAERAIARGAADRYRKARKLEECVGFVAWTRGSHEESQALQRSVSRLLAQSFARIDWRTPLISGL